jgi:hypothetical protein
VPETGARPCEEAGTRRGAEAHGDQADTRGGAAGRRGAEGGAQSGLAAGKGGPQPVDACVVCGGGLQARVADGSDRPPD